MRKFYGESEAKLREVFEQAARHAPAILFIDEIDAVAQKRTEVAGEVEKRVVAQLLSLMDGFVSRGQVIVIGATNIPEVLDPALRRPGRFDREIEIGVPNTQARLQILRIHSRAMPLGPDVDLEEIAEHSHGFVGADLEALCQEIGMIALRRYLSSIRTTPDAPIDEADAGGLHVTREDCLAGLKEVEPSATREFFIEKSSTTFASIGGLDDVKRLLDAVVEHAHMHDEVYEQVGLTPPRGILLVGPSGTGKTAIARALSGEKQIPLIAIDGPQLYSKWLGESEKALREVFKKARRAAPCLLFFDTIDAIAPRTGADHTNSDVYQRILSQLAREIDNLRDVKGVILMAATNRPERVEPALLRSGRFDYNVRFAKPDAADRAAIVRICCRQVPVALDVDLDAMARRAEGYTGADLETLCKKATLLAIAEFHSGARGTPFRVHERDFLAVLETGPSPEAAS
jgi:transitional endoplasmic reticulum ATPase